MSIKIGIGLGIPFRRGGGIDWEAYWASQYISLLIVETISDTEQKITATIVGAEYDGVSYERSLDNITYVEDGTEATGIHNATGLTANTIYYWRARLYKGTHYGAYSNIAVAADSFLADGNTVFKYTPKIIGCIDNGHQPVITDETGVESIWYDMMVGKTTFGAEESSGSTVEFAIYKITATQAAHFYAGCAIGQIFIARTVKTIDANNKVQRMLGNHLTNPKYDYARPINGVFEGTNDYLKTALFTWDQPNFIYAILRQITWTGSDAILDGVATSRAKLEQYDTGGTPKLRVIGTIASTMTISPTLNEFFILRMLNNGAGSKLVLNNNEPVLSNFGTNNMGGFTIGGNGGGAANSNIEAGDIAIGRKIADTPQNEAGIYNYLNYLYKLSSGSYMSDFEVANEFDNGKLVIGMDATRDSLYDEGLPIFIAQGIKTTMWVQAETVGVAGFSNWTEIAAFAANECDIQSHPQASLQGNTVAENLAILAAEDVLIMAQGYAKPDHAVYFGGNYDTNTLLAMAQSGKKTGGTISTSNPEYSHTFPKTNKYILPRINIGKTNITADGVDVDRIKLRMDYCKAHKTAIIYYMHGMDDAQPDDWISAANLNTIIDYAQAIGLDIITISELSDLM